MTWPTLRLTWDRDVAIESIDRLAALEDAGARVHVCRDAGHWGHVQPVSIVHEEKVVA